MLNYYTGVLKNYVGFQGRARRAEYWQYFLVNFIITVVLEVLAAAISFPALVYIFEVAVLLPSLAVGVRRLHDTDRTGWWILIALIPIVGWIVFLVFACSEGTRGPNKYGADPKNPGVDAAVAYTTL